MKSGTPLRARMKNPGMPAPDTFLQLVLNMSHRPLLNILRLNSVAESAEAKPFR